MSSISATVTPAETDAKYQGKNKRLATSPTVADRVTGPTFMSLLLGGKSSEVKCRFRLPYAGILLLRAWILK